MCYETYERLLRARASRRAADRAAAPDREEPLKPDAHNPPVHPATPDQVQTREEELA
jgi:hypothetical protein